MTTKNPEDIVQRLGYLALGTRLKRIGERLQADSQRVLAAHDLSIPAAQFPFLVAIDRLGPMTIGELARAVGVTQPGTTRTVAQLEALGLLAEAPSGSDQRRRRMALTTQGRRVVGAAEESAWPVIERAVRELCQELGGPLLDQLTAIEEALEAVPLHRRAEAIRGGKRRRR